MADNQFINFNSQDVADMYRRNQYARMLQDQAAAPIERASYKGIEADIHPMQGVAKLTAALLAGYQQNRMDKSYANEKAAAEQKVVAERERSNQAFKDFQQGFQPKVGYGAPTSGGTTGAGAGPGDMAPQGQMTATALSPQERLAHAMTAYGSPDERVRSYGQAMVQNENTMAQNEAKTAEREQDRLDRDKYRDQQQKNFESTQAQTKLLASEKLKQGNQPTESSLEKAAEKKQGATNAATTIKQLAEDYVSLNKIGGMRNLNQNVLGRSAASIENTVPYALQSKDASRLRERIEANIESLVGPLMRASGMTTQMLNSNVERAAFMRTLGGPGTSFETNISILKRMNDALNFDPNKKSGSNADIDKYAPEGK